MPRGGAGARTPGCQKRQGHTPRGLFFRGPTKWEGGGGGPGPPDAPRPARHAAGPARRHGRGRHGRRAQHARGAARGGGPAGGGDRALCGGGARVCHPAGRRRAPVRAAPRRRRRARGRQAGAAPGRGAPAAAPGRLLHPGTLRPGALRRAPRRPAERANDAARAVAEEAGVRSGAPRGGLEQVVRRDAQAPAGGLPPRVPRYCPASSSTADGPAGRSERDDARPILPREPLRNLDAAAAQRTAGDRRRLHQLPDRLDPAVRRRFGKALVVGLPTRPTGSPSSRSSPRASPPPSTPGVLRQVAAAAGASGADLEARYVEASARRMAAVRSTSCPGRDRPAPTTSWRGPGHSRSPTGSRRQRGRGVGPTACRAAAAAAG